MTAPSLAVFKLASCDGCQLSLLDLEDELLALSRALDIVHFPEATTAHEAGPYDLVLVEGSITTERDRLRIEQIRSEATTLITIGACATAGGIQALRNRADVAAWAGWVYPSPEQLSTLATSTPVGEHVVVDYELRGCPVDKYQLLELVGAVLAGRRPVLPTHSVCVDCKARSAVCVMVAGGIPCLGPVTQSGCGALCPAHGRGCYGCFGPAETVNTASLATQWMATGTSKDELERAFLTFNAAAPAFSTATDDLGDGPHAPD